MNDATSPDTAPRALRAQLARQIMWNRLIAVVEEGAQVLLKTAFGAITREAGDLSAGVYDTRGRMLAQAVTGTPGHVNTMAAAVSHFLERYPAGAMHPGDVYVTNDPWMGTGHLFDFVVVTPVFRREKLVGFFAATCHVIDIGGRGFTAEARSVYEEGILIPHMPLMERGQPNESLFRIVAANVRDPLQVRGDIFSLVAANDAGAKRLLEMMEEFAIDSIDELGDYIVETSRQGMIDAIAKLPRGTYRASMPLDGYDEPVRLELALIVSDEGMTIDYAGSSAASRYGINSPKCYTDAYTVFGVKCIVAPDVPNNAGSLEVVKVLAPEGSIVHPLRPAPVTARHVIGQMLPELVFGALELPMSGRVPAEGAGSIWVLAMGSGHETALGVAHATRFTTMSVGIGGVGGRPGKDGLSAVAFPSGVGAIPVEITEAACPLVFTRRELRSDSAGAGEYRGGLGTFMAIENLESAPFTISAATFDRRANAARGRAGGQDGTVGSVRLASGEVFTGKGVYTVPSADKLLIDMPGGGGYGDPLVRDAARVADEVADGLLSVAAARDAYGVVTDRHGELDFDATARLRRELSIARGAPTAGGATR
jgi:N-methylhydantoinase B